MRFLLLNQFYPPDVAPTGQYLHDLARVLVERGHQVRVICSRRSYDGKKSFFRRETLDGVEITRIPATGFGRRGFAGKMLDYVSFYGTLFATLMFGQKRPDVILSLTTPPYIGLLGKLAAVRHRCRHAHWVMDLYPDVMLAHGMAKTESIFTRLLRKLTQFQLRGADCIVALGPVMAGKVSAYTRGSFKEHSVYWTPLWSDPKLAPWPANRPNPSRSEHGWKTTDVVFLYSGNMGLGHRFGEFLQTAKRLGSTRSRWVFAGGGKRKSEIENFAASNPAAGIQILDYAPHDSLGSHLCAADVHLASLDSRWAGLMVPSKLQGSFAVARPVLYVGGRDCETAAWIRESGGGWIIDEGDIEGLLAAVEQALDGEERRKRGQAALDFAQKYFQMQTNCGCIAQMLETGTVAKPAATRDVAQAFQPAGSGVFPVASSSRPADHSKV
jgi:colanic acid biosynthesis glycosyl transferase WcaI